MMMKFLLVFVVLANFAFAQVPGGERLDYFLDLDRFQFYCQEWSRTMKGRGKVELADAVMSWTAPEIAALKPDPKKLKDAFNYDDLILQFLKKKNPAIKATKEDVAWGYDFYKRKLNEAYLVKGGKPGAEVAQNLMSAPSSATPYPLKPLESDQVLLNVDSYASDRTTRAVFWEASEAGRRIELHVGTAANFKEEMERRGAKVLGEVYPKARNYNPIYLVQDPGEKTFHYAISEIAGEDRVRHLAMQSALVRWENASGGKLAPPPVNVVGQSVAKLAAEEAELTQVLKVLPKADHVVIGQKGAFERTFGSLGKATAILKIQSQNPEILAAALTPEQMKLVEKASKDVDDLATNVMKNASGWDKVYEAAQANAKAAKLLPELNYTSYNLDRASYEVSDYIMLGKDGKEQRWRVFSNSWGDEVLPVARALKNSGQTNVVYIGTAGALPQSDLKVGDLITPKKTQDINGVVRPVSGDVIAPSAKTVDVVTNVSSPYQETKAWLKEKTGFAQAVEVETGYLSSVFNGKNDKLSIMLLVSDVVGSEGETLAEASSSIRRNAQIAAITTVLNDAGVVAPAVIKPSGGIGSLIDELIPNKDLAYKFQFLREAQYRGLDKQPNPRKALQTLIDETPSFTTSRLYTSLSQSGDRLNSFIALLESEGIAPRMAIEQGFLEGRWGPGRPIEIHLQVKTKKALDELNQVIALASKQDKSFAKLLRVTGSVDAPGKEFVRLASMPEGPEVLTGLYRDAALGFGGLATTETTSGSFKFVKVAEPSGGQVLENLAYFAPDETTAELLSKFGDDAKMTSFLESRVQYLNSAVPEKAWQIVIKPTDKLPGGALAQLVPEFPPGANKNLQITLYMTKDGLKNPAVVMEELIHLEQITGVAPINGITKGKAFVHPYHWAETVANAQAGSLAAMEKLAAVELEAAMMANNTLDTYQANGLFTEVSDNKMLQDYLEAREAHAQAAYKEVAKAYKADRKLKLAAWEKQKGAFAKLEAQKLKLNDLIAKGDRKGVRKLIDAYLPWDLMEPSEKKMWTDWLEAMEKPNPKSTKLIFRGLDGDLILRTADGKPYLLSTVLSKNQGSYTRRLRSLSTLRDKFGVNMHQEYDKVKYVLTGRKDPSALSVMMMNHARDPMGSPFISASNYQTASGFGSKQMSALMIDERRMMPNALAVNYLSEQERLIPLIVFPDEVVHYVDYGTSSWDPNKQQAFIKEVEAKTGKAVPAELLSMQQTQGQFLEEAVDKAEANFLDGDNLPVEKACSVKSGPGCSCLFKTLNALLK